MSTTEEPSAAVKAYEAGYEAGAAEVRASVERWSMVNEIAAPPLDWAGLGAVLHPWLHEEAATDA